MKLNWVKSGLLGLLMSCVYSLGAQAEDFLLRAEVKASDGTHVQISAPLCLLELLKTSIPAPVPISKEELSPMINALMNDLSSMKGNDLVRVEGEDEVRVWIDEVNSNQPEEANFIKVDVKPGGKDEPEAHVCIPKGLLLLASHIGNKVLEAHSQELFSHFGHIPPIPAPPVHQAEMKKEEAKKAVKEAQQQKMEVEKTAEKIKSEVLEKVIQELKKNLKMD